ncbi:MAG TPA: hypothetical protein VFK79_03125 [Xanthobacteraceae bacterium]|nr:hypothetical protein [Xanthobacteraceae bacterium]
MAPLPLPAGWIGLASAAGAGMPERVSGADRRSVAVPSRAPGVVTPEGV